MPKGFLFDVNKCTGCQACEIACTIENALEPGRSWRQVNTFNEFRYPEAPLFHLSTACNHCADAPCMKSCPALAYSRDTDSGAVTIDPEACIGCRYCSWACPYDAPRYDADTGIMTKCTFCNHRLQQGIDPACVDLCPTNALQYGELDREDLVETVPGFDTRGIEPAVRFAPLDRELRLVSLDPTGDSRPLQRPRASHITLRSEWPLVLFTLAAACLVGVWTASLRGEARPHAIPFLGCGVAAMSLGTAHLGKKRRAWRAALNLKRSWLSREVVFYSMFLALSTLAAATRQPSALLEILASLMGFAALFVMDRVYDVTNRITGVRIHSSDVVWTGLLVTFWLLQQSVLVTIIGAIKLGLYLSRKLRRRHRGEDARPRTSAARLALGFVLPALLAVLRPTGWDTVALASALAGELIDRCEFYDELQPHTPQRQMEIDLRHLLSATS